MAEKITGQVQIKGARLKQVKTAVNNIKQLKQELEKNLDKEATRTLEVLFAGSVNLDASDIHVEPEEEDAKLRLRIDGILHDIVDLPRKTYELLLSRTKLLAGIKLNITDRAQDGRFTILLEEEPVEVRASSLPAEYGESIVLRILNPKSLIEVEQLGIRPDTLDVFKKEILQPNGMILVTGPTGSGKTTTLYAILKKIQRPEIKIITIEDPIEYHLDNISQTQVRPKKGYDFATGLQAIVRQDPDVILVGEIRNAKTAKIALQAALTGHLVLSTLHTNDAAGTIARLQAFKEKPGSIASAINLAMAQRLIRKVCSKCVKMTKPSKEELTKLKKTLSSLPKKAKIKIPVLDKDLKIPKAQGCSACNLTGYKGRIGIFEFFLNDESMESFILQNPSVSALRRKARETGMVTMKEDGFIKITQGMTTLEEVERITGV